VLSARYAIEITHYVRVIDFETFQLNKSKNKHVNQEFVTIALVLIWQQYARERNGVDTAKP